MVESVQLPNAAAEKRRKKRKKAEPTIQNNNITTSEVASTNDNYRQGRWTKEEKDMYLLGLEQHGNDLRAIQLMIPTRSLTQITGHAVNLAKSRADEQVQAHKRRKKRQAGKLASICNHFECNRPVFGFKFCKYHVRTNINRNLVENFALSSLFFFSIFSSSSSPSLAYPRSAASSIRCLI